MRSIFFSILFILLTANTTMVFGQEWQPVTDPVDIFREGYVQVVGTSEEGQSKFKALTAAKVVAQRELVEVIQGLTLSGETTVRDGMLQNDTIHTAVKGFLRGAIKCGERYDRAYRFAEVCMKVNLRGKGGLVETILPLAKKENMITSNMQPYRPSSSEVSYTKPADSTRTEPVVARPSEITNPHDGLIIDARGQNFRPALVNRIITEKNEVIFDPSKIVSSVLVEKGCGGFTNEESKAMALLSNWGAKKPLTVKAKGSANNTDIKVSDDDASAIFIHDKKSNFLAQANVVFVLQ